MAPTDWHQCLECQCVMKIDELNAHTCSNTVPPPAWQVLPVGACAEDIPCRTPAASSTEPLFSNSDDDVPTGKGTNDCGAALADTYPGGGNPPSHSIGLRRCAFDCDIFRGGNKVVRLLQAADGLHDAVVELLPPFRAGFLFYDTRVGDGDLDRQGVPRALRALSLKGLNTNARAADRQEVGGVVLKVVYRRHVTSRISQWVYNIEDQPLFLLSIRADEELGSLPTHTKRPRQAQPNDQTPAKRPAKRQTGSSIKLDGLVGVCHCGKAAIVKRSLQGRYFVGCPQWSPTNRDGACPSSFRWLNARETQLLSP